MKVLAALLLTGLISAHVHADDGTLRYFHSRSDVIVLGEFASGLLEVVEEAGVVHYHGEFKIEQLIKGDVMGNQKPGGTIAVSLVRFEMEPQDRHPLLQKGGKAILFLRCNDRQSPPTYTAADQWFAIQPASPNMAKRLSRLPGEKSETRLPNVDHLSAAGKKDVAELDPVAIARNFLIEQKVETSNHFVNDASIASYAPGQPTKFDWLITFPNRAQGDPILVAVTKQKNVWRLDPKTLEQFADQPAVAAKDAAPTKSRSVDLSGEWRMFLPAGFEHKITLLDADNGEYSVQPGGYTFGGRYRVEGDRLIGKGAHENQTGNFVWQMRSKHFLTLIEQPSGYNADYTGAILYRPNAEQLLRESNGAKVDPPSTAVDE